MKRKTFFTRALIGVLVLTMVPYGDLGGAFAQGDTTGKVSPDTTGKVSPGTTGKVSPGATGNVSRGGTTGGVRDPAASQARGQRLHATPPGKGGEKVIRRAGGARGPISGSRTNTGSISRSTISGSGSVLQRMGPGGADSRTGAAPPGGGASAGRPKGGKAPGGGKTPPFGGASSDYHGGKVPSGGGKIPPRGVKHK